MRRHVPLLAVALAALVPAPALGEDLVETTEHLYVHNAAEGCSDRSLQFLVYDEPTSGVNCGYIYGLPLNEVEHQTSAGVFPPREYSTQSGFGINLDASRDLTGTVVVASRTSVCPSPAPPPVPCVETGAGTGAGEVVVDVVATGRVGAFTTVSLGSAEVSTLVTPGTTTFEIPFTIDLPDSVDRRVLNGVTLSIHARGIHVHSGYVNASGSSFIDVPSLTPVEASA